MTYGSSEREKVRAFREVIILCFRIEDAVLFDALGLVGLEYQEGSYFSIVDKGLVLVFTFSLPFSFGGWSFSFPF